MNVDELISDFGFILMSTPEISEKTNRLIFPNVARGQFRNVLYTIAIDDVLVYVGKSNDFWKRSDTYKNALYWKSAWESNKNKTRWLEHAIRNNQKVQFLCRRYLNQSSMEKEEDCFISKIKPTWNKNHNKENYEAFI